jgi:hypothetical protein
VNGPSWKIGAAVALLVAVAVSGVAHLPTTVALASPAWRRLVRGPTLDGVLYPGARAVVAWPDLPRDRPRTIVIEGAPLAEGAATLSVAIDGSAPTLVAVTANRPGIVSLPRAPRAGLRLDLEVLRGTTPLRLQAIRAGGAVPPLAPLALLALIAAALVVAVARLEGLTAVAGLALGACAAGLAVLATTVMSGGVALGTAAPGHAMAGLLLAAGTAAGLASRSPSRGAFGRALLVVAAFAGGALLRGFFLPSAGSWDMDYWRAWTERAREAGTTGVYGPPLEAGQLVPQLRGDAPLWTVERDGRSFTVDYPPLAMFVWRSAARLVGPDAGDATGWAVALKLPAVLGDLAAVALLAAWGTRRREAVRRAALFWILPASWLSSAVLGYLDGAYAPLVLAAALFAGSARASLSGAALSLAALVKPTALVALPAAAVALREKKALVRGALAGLGVVAAVLAPFVLTGTLGTAAVHVSRIVLQERLSGGYASLWWAVGALLSGSGSGEVPYVRLADTALPVRGLGVAAFLGAAVVLGRALARRRGPSATAAAAGALFASYGVLAAGVHVNHPHPMVLLFVAAGMGGRPWRWATWTLLTSYTVNIVLLEGLGRLNGPRYGALEAAGAVAEAARLAPGFDVTLLLAVANVVALAAILARARAGLDAAEPRPS